MESIVLNLFVVEHLTLTTTNLPSSPWTITVFKTTYLSVKASYHPKYKGTLVQLYYLQQKWYTCVHVQILRYIIFKYLCNYVHRCYACMQLDVMQLATWCYATTCYATKL